MTAIRPPPPPPPPPPPKELYISFLFQYSYDRNRADWDREARGKPLIRCVELTKWLFVYGGKRDQANAQNFLTALMRVAPPMGFKISPPHV